MVYAPELKHDCPECGCSQVICPVKSFNKGKVCSTLMCTVCKYGEDGKWVVEEDIKIKEDEGTWP